MSGICWEQAACPSAIFLKKSLLLGRTRQPTAKSTGRIGSRPGGQPPPPQPPFGRPRDLEALAPRWREAAERERAGAPRACRTASSSHPLWGGRSAGEARFAHLFCGPPRIPPNRRPPWRSALRPHHSGARERRLGGNSAPYFSCSLLPCFLAANPPRPGATDRRGTGIRPGGPARPVAGAGRPESRRPAHGIHPAVAAPAAAATAGEFHLLYEKNLTFASAPNRIGNRTRIIAPRPLPRQLPRVSERCEFSVLRPPRGLPR